MWCVPQLDEAYAERMNDVLALYEKPHNPAQPVVCLDEKPVVLHQDKRPGCAARPGQPGKRDYEYKRRGTANVFCAVEPLAGRHFTWPTPNRSGAEFAKTLHRLAAAYPSAQTIHLVLDNLNTHTGASLYEAFPPEEARRLLERLEFHYTPKHASWLNMAEIEIGIMNRQCLDRRIDDADLMRQEIAAWEEARNAKQAKIHWTFTISAARVKLKKLYPSNQQ